MNGWSSMGGDGWDDEPAWVYEITWEWEPQPGQRYPGDPGRRKAVHTPVYEASGNNENAARSGSPMTYGGAPTQHDQGRAPQGGYPPPTRSGQAPQPPQQSRPPAAPRREEPLWNRPAGTLPEQRSEEQRSRTAPPDQRRGAGPVYGRQAESQPPAGPYQSREGQRPPQFRSGGQVPVNPGNPQSIPVNPGHPQTVPVNPGHPQHDPYPPAGRGGTAPVSPGRPGSAPGGRATPEGSSSPQKPVSPASPGVYGAARPPASGPYYGRRHASEDQREGRPADEPRPVSPAAGVYGSARPAPADAFPSRPSARPAPGQRDGRDAAPFDLRPAPPERGTPAEARPAPQPTRVTPSRPATPAPTYPTVPGRPATSPAPPGPASAAPPVRPVSGPAHYDPTATQPVQAPHGSRPNHVPAQPTSAQPVSPYPTQPGPAEPVMEPGTPHRTPPAAAQPVSPYPTQPAAAQPVAEPVSPHRTRPADAQPVADPFAARPVSAQPTGYPAQPQHSVSAQAAASAQSSAPAEHQTSAPNQASAPPSPASAQPGRPTEGDAELPSEPPAAEGPRSRSLWERPPASEAAVEQGSQPVSAVPASAPPTTAAGDDEPHGLGWLLSQSGLGAVTPLPPPIPQSIAEPPMAQPVAIEPVDEPGPPALISSPPARSEPAKIEPVADMPVADIPIADAPVADMPIADMPIADMPAADMPVADMPAAVEPEAPAQPLVDEARPVSAVPERQDWFAPSGAQPFVVPNRSQESTTDLDDTTADGSEDLHSPATEPTPVDSPVTGTEPASDHAEAPQYADLPYTDYDAPLAVQSIAVQPATADPVQLRPTPVRPIFAEPSHDEPVAAQPSHDQPSHAEPVSAQPSHNQPSHLEPFSAEPVAWQPIATDRAQTQPAPAEPSSPRPDWAEPALPESALDQPVGSDRDAAQPISVRPESVQPDWGRDAEEQAAETAQEQWSPVEPVSARPSAGRHTYEDLRSEYAAPTDQPELVKPVSAQPFLAQPVSAQPYVSTQPFSAAPVSPQPYPVRPASAMPVDEDRPAPHVSTEPISAAPVSAQPGSTRPDAAEPVSAWPAPDEPAPVEPVSAVPHEDEPVVEGSATPWSDAPETDDAGRWADDHQPAAVFQAEDVHDDAEPVEAELLEFETASGERVIVQAYQTVASSVDDIVDAEVIDDDPRDIVPALEAPTPAPALTAEPSAPAEEREAEPVEHLSDAADNLQASQPEWSEDSEADLPEPEHPHTSEAASPSEAVTPVEAEGVDESTGTEEAQPPVESPADDSATHEPDSEVDNAPDGDEQPPVEAAAASNTSEDETVAHEAETGEADAEAAEGETRGPGSPAYGERAEADDAAPPPVAAPAEPIRQRREQRADARNRRTDPEQILAAYPVTYDPRTLREQIEDDEAMWVVIDRLTDKLEYAERDTDRARLLSLRAVASRLLGDLDPALEDARAALVHAEVAGGLVRTATVRARLAHVLQWRAEYAEADRLYEEAGSAELPARLRAEIHELAGRSAFEQGRYLEAVNHLERALDLRKGIDLDLVERIELALDTITGRTTEGWGPYPRSREEILGGPAPTRPLRDEASGLWGYPGVLPPRFAQAQPFADGVAWVRRPEAPAWELIDLSGELLIDASAGYRAAGRFSDGLAWVSRDDAGGWFAVDKQNRVIVPGGFEDARPFHNALALVRRGGWGAVDQHGRIVVQPHYRAFATMLSSGEPVDGFTEEGLAVIDAGEVYGVVDRAGQLLVQPTHAALLIHPAAFLVADKYGLWGALNRAGETLVELKYRDRADVLEQIDLLVTELRPVL